MSKDLAASRGFAVTSAVLSAGFGLPLFVDPNRWARWFTWADQETDLGNYLGRCLGATALGFAASGAAAARDPDRHRSHFVASEVAAWLMAAAHVRGALERRQPVIETVETLGWTALAVGARRYAPR